MDVITRMLINGALVVLATALMGKSILKLYRMPQIPIECHGRAEIELKFIAIFCLMFLFMTFDWITHGRVFVLPVQIELGWSALFVWMFAMLNHHIDSFHQCPMAKSAQDVMITVLNQDQKRKAEEMTFH